MSARNLAVEPPSRLLSPPGSPSGAGMVTIILADDHPLVRAGMRSTLSREADLQIVAEAANGREAIELCSVYRPNVAVIDVGMPELNGLEAASRIVTAKTNTHVVMLSMHSDETYIM